MTQTPFDPTQIDRPDPILFKYYVWVSILTGPFVLIVFLPLWFRYITLRYRFDEEGISMSWGVLFRQEINLTYRRIQDIHLTRNILERWMGLAKIKLQTASGSSQAEMKIEGILASEALRDFLYSRMRGAKNPMATRDSSANATLDYKPAADAEKQPEVSPLADRATVALEGIRDSMQKLVQQKSESQS